MTWMLRSTGVYRIRLLMGLLACVLCVEARVAQARETSVILISLDGTPPEAARRQGLPALYELSRLGVRAERLTPVFPTNTFPNHVTFVTGVVPERHGIVNNVFVDPERGRFSYSADPTWIEVEPIWSILAAQGIVSAAFHWVGSEGPWRTGLGPADWRRFDNGTPESEKVDQILAWLQIEDPGLRPRLITTYFRGGDRTGHRFGPNAEPVWEALRRQDREIARLVQEIERLGLWQSSTLLLVSDHGMETVRKNINLARAFSSSGIEAKLYGGGGFATVSVEGDAREVEHAIAQTRSLGLEAYALGEAPAELRLSNPRFGDFVVMAPPGTAISRSPKSWLERIASWFGLGALGGSHGYRPEVESMGALFVAFGRGVPEGVILDEVRAIDIAPTVLKLLGVETPSWMEGQAVGAISAP